MPSSNTLSLICESLTPATPSADSLKSVLKPEPELRIGNINNNVQNNNIHVRNNNHNHNNHNNNNNAVPTDRRPLNNGVPLNRPAEETVPNLSYDSALKYIQYYSFLILSYVDMTVLEKVRDILVGIVLTIYGLLLGLVLSLIPRRLRFKDISGQVVLITGAGSGIGRLMAKKFATHGATIVVWDINEQGMEETVKEVRASGRKAHGYIVDVTSRDKIFAAAEKVKSEVGKVDILINNAGIVSGSRFLDTKDSMIEKTFQVNALANFWTCKAFLPDMLKTSQGHIVTIASSAGLTGVNRLVDYCASKYAAVGFHDALVCELKSELGGDGIHATLVCPYYINTGMFDGVKSKLIPILEPDDVVEDITAGVLSNQEIVVIPRYVLYLCVFKYFIPSNIGMKLQEILGITGTMLGFKGRAGGVKEAQKTK